MKVLPIVLATAALLAACTIPEPVVDDNALPVKHREELLPQIHRRLADPTGIREPFISEPALRPVQGTTSRPVVCVRFNPKDQSGRYTGTVEMAAVYHKQNLMSFTTSAGDLCKGASYQPYPELSKLCVHINCQAAAGAAQ
jgi:hypothetical protein